MTPECTSVLFGGAYRYRHLSCTLTIAVPLQAKYRNVSQAWGQRCEKPVDIGSTDDVHLGRGTCLADYIGHVLKEPPPASFSAQEFFRDIACLIPQKSL